MNVRRTPCLLLLFLITASACTPLAPLPSNLPQEQLTLALYYTHGTTPRLPLVGAFLRDEIHSDQADLGLMLVSGQRFARCRYKAGIVRCETPHVRLANFIAQCVAATLAQHSGSRATSDVLAIVQHDTDGYTCERGAHRLDIRFMPTRD
ncbi:MAG: hypothetical protein J5861_03615 [Desulfovibrio sp.]|nr:hypothetical protein [Desulfovibrio sp.]